MRLKRDRFEKLVGRKKAEAAPPPPPPPPPPPEPEPIIVAAPAGDTDTSRLERRLKIIQADLNSLPSRLAGIGPQAPQQVAPTVDPAYLDYRLSQMEDNLRAVMAKQSAETWVFDVKRNPKGQIERVEAKKAEIE